MVTICLCQSQLCTSFGAITRTTSTACYDIIFTSVTSEIWERVDIRAPTGMRYELSDEPAVTSLGAVLVPLWAADVAQHQSLYAVRVFGDNIIGHAGAFGAVMAQRSSVKSASISHLIAHLFGREPFQMLLVALYGDERLKWSCIKFPIRPLKSCDSTGKKYNALLKEKIDFKKARLIILDLQYTGVKLQMICNWPNSNHTAAQRHLVAPVSIYWPMNVIRAGRAWDFMTVPSHPVQCINRICFGSRLGRLARPGDRRHGHRTTRWWLHGRRGCVRAGHEADQICSKKPRGPQQRETDSHTLF